MTPDEFVAQFNNADGLLGPFHGNPLVIGPYLAPVYVYWAVVHEGTRSEGGSPQATTKVYSSDQPTPLWQGADQKFDTYHLNFDTLENLPGHQPIHLAALSTITLRAEYWNVDAAVTKADFLYRLALQPRH